MQSLANKTALITGAGKGLGRAMALQLAQEGVNLYLLGRTPKDLEAVASEVKALNPNVLALVVTVDVGSYEEVQAAIANIAKEVSTVDILVNNAGILKTGGILDLSVSEWEEVFQINVLGTYYMLREVLPLMIGAGKGDVINIASTSGAKGVANMSAYGASKAAVINLTESVMQEVRKKNIRVTTVNPSTVATDMTLNAKFTDGNPDRVLQPEDLAYLVVCHLKLPGRAFVKEFGLWSTNP